MKILIVDDHVLFREGLISVLRSHPEHEVVGEAGSVREAIECTLLQKPELILMDYSLPDGTGADAAKRILAVQPHCKIVFLTMHESDDILFDAIRSGAKGYMLKNLQVPVLLASLRAVERGEPVFTHAMTGRIVDAFARSTTEPKDLHSDKLSMLSCREKEVLGELASGTTNQEIGVRLCLSENTVRHHIHNILKKLELRNRREAAAYAKQNGLIPPSESSAISN